MPKVTFWRVEKRSQKQAPKRLPKSRPRQVETPAEAVTSEAPSLNLPMPKVTFWREKRSQKQARQFSKRPAYSPKGSLRHLQLSAKAVTARPSSQPGSAKSWSVGPCHCNTPPGHVSLSPPRRWLCRSETAAVGYIVPPNFFEPLVMGFLGRAPLAGYWGRRIIWWYSNDMTDMMIYQCIYIYIYISMWINMKFILQWLMGRDVPPPTNWCQDWASGKCCFSTTVRWTSGLLGDSTGGMLSYTWIIGISQASLL